MRASRRMLTRDAWPVSWPAPRWGGEGGSAQRDTRDLPFLREGASAKAWEDKPHGLIYLPMRHLERDNPLNVTLGSSYDKDPSE